MTAFKFLRCTTSVWRATSARASAWASSTPCTRPGPWWRITSKTSRNTAWTRGIRDSDLQIDCRLFRIWLLNYIIYRYITECRVYFVHHHYFFLCQNCNFATREKGFELLASGIVRMCREHSGALARNLGCFTSTWVAITEWRPFSKTSALAHTWRRL